MDPIDRLPPDLSAVLSLLLRQGRSYGEIADMLRIPESAVRDRAHAALDAISAGDEEAPGVPAETTPAGARTPSPSASAPRPRTPSPSRAAPSATSSQTPSSSRTPSASSTRAGGSLSKPPASRRAGALLLAIVVVIVVVVVLVTSGGGGSSHKAASSSSTTTSGSGTSTNGEPHIDKQLNLVSPEPGSKAVGLVEILSEGSKKAFLVTAEHLPPTGNGFFYAAWLYNSSSEARVLGRAPSVGANGQLQAVGALPANASNYRQMLITQETTAKPSHPGPIVLSGPFSLH
jgi:hypothetical protein